jgi:hypothetical protein
MLRDLWSRDGCRKMEGCCVNVCMGVCGCVCMCLSLFEFSFADDGWAAQGCVHQASVRVRACACVCEGKSFAAVWRMRMMMENGEWRMEGVEWMMDGG